VGVGRQNLSRAAWRRDTAAGERFEGEAADLLREVLTEIEAPDDQLERLGLD